MVVFKVTWPNNSPHIMALSIWWRLCMSWSCCSVLTVVIEPPGWSIKWECYWSVVHLVCPTGPPSAEEGFCHPVQGRAVLTCNQTPTTRPHIFTWLSTRLHSFCAASFNWFFTCIIIHIKWASEEKVSTYLCLTMSHYSYAIIGGILNTPMWKWCIHIWKSNMNGPETGLWDLQVKYV